MKPTDSLSLSTHTDIDFSGKYPEADRKYSEAIQAGRLDNLENQNQLAPHTVYLNLTPPWINTFFPAGKQLLRVKLILIRPSYGLWIIEHGY